MPNETESNMNLETKCSNKISLHVKDTKVRLVVKNINQTCTFVVFTVQRKSKKSLEFNLITVYIIII